MNTRIQPPRVLFNASVIFSAYCSAKGASRALILLLKQKRIDGIISETILDELLKHADKIPMGREQLRHEVVRSFGNILPAPEEKNVSQYKHLMLDHGDAHLFATAKEEHCTHLVSLDKKHVLSLKNKLHPLHIVSPAELILALKDDNTKK